MHEDIRRNVTLQAPGLRPVDEPPPARRLPTTYRGRSRPTPYEDRSDQRLSDGGASKTRGVLAVDGGCNGEDLKIHNARRAGHLRAGGT